MGLVQIRVKNKKHYGRTLNYSFGIVEVDASGFAMIEEEIALKNPMSFILESTTDQVIGLDPLKKGEDVKKSSKSGILEKESLDKQLEVDFDSKADENVEVSSGEFAEEDIDVIAALEKELEMKGINDLKSLAKDLKISRSKWSYLNKSQLVKFLAKRI